MRLIIFFFFVFAFIPGWSNTLPVTSSGRTSLKEAVARALPGDTILIQKGVYREGNIIINKPLFILGVNNPVLDGENKFEIFTLTGSRIVIKGIHFKNSGYSSTNDYASVSAIDASYVIIENNRFEGAYFAIKFANASHSIVRNNTVIGFFETEQGSGNGIHFWKCNNMLVVNNRISGHRDGIYFEFVTESFIQGNLSEKNIRYGLHFMFSNNDAYMENTFRNNGAGVAVMYSHHVIMIANNFLNNWGSNAYGLLLKEISDGKILKNKFLNNTAGILMESTNRIEVLGNSFAGNGWAFRIQASCDENLVHYNNFEGNTFDIATNGSLMQNHFTHNYWDKYEGYDLNRDGVGDVSYHPVSLYSMVIEQNPHSILLLRSFMVSLMDKAEKAIPSLTPELFADEAPMMKSHSL